MEKAPSGAFSLFRYVGIGWSVCWVSGSSSVSAQHDAAVYDKDMRVVDFEDLKYSPVSQTAHLEGVVVIRVKLDDKGKVVDAVAISGSELLIHNCLENEKKWHFEPNSEKAAVIVYNFRIEGQCHPGEAASHLIFYPPNFASIIGCGLTAEP